MKRINTEVIRNNPSYYAHLTRSNWSAIIQPSGAGELYWEKLFLYFPEHQLFFEDEDGGWLGFANTIPVSYHGDVYDLPEEGWDWLLETGITGYEKGITPNLLGGLQIGINPTYRRQGWSSYILANAKSFAKEIGLEGFILPIRPTLKDQHPDVSMEDYLLWKKEDKIFDPWIRIHLRNGAEIIKVCHRAMVVEGTVEDWENWTGKTFDKTGKYVVEGGLSLVNINLPENKGIYEEPNIWIKYTL